MIEFGVTVDIVLLGLSGKVELKKSTPYRWENGYDKDDDDAYKYQRIPQCRHEKNVLRSLKEWIGGGKLGHDIVWSECRYSFC